MKISRKSMLALGLALTGLMVAVLVGQPAEAKSAKSGKHLMMAEGKIKSLDGNQVSLELDNGAVLTLHADQDSKVMLGNKSDLSLSSLSVGQPAKVRYSKEGRSLVWIRVKEASQKAK